MERDTTGIVMVKVGQGLPIHQEEIAAAPLIIITEAHQEPKHIPILLVTDVVLLGSKQPPIMEDISIILPTHENVFTTD
jgi:hypothetical protein